MDQSLIDRISAITSNQGIESGRLSRLNALLYRVVTSKGLVSYDINDIELIFRENNTVDFVELSQEDESRSTFLSQIIDVFKGYVSDHATESVHIHFFVDKDGYDEVINSLDLIMSNVIDTNVGIWHSDNTKVEVLLIINKKSSTYESNLHR